MMVVLFEALPAPGKESRYLDLAAELRPELDRIDGFLSIERFRSLTHPDTLLSLSFWRDEAAISVWRNGEAHRETQAEGRRSVFSDYRLRIAAVVRDYGMSDRAEAPPDSQTAYAERSAADEDCSRL